MRDALRIGIQLFAAMFAFAAAGCGAAPPPDVVLVTIDTLRADRLGTYGYPLDTSPSIDALASQAVVFERAIAAAGRTAPSHASIFTSQYVRGHSIGFRNGDTRIVGGVTLAEAFSGAGYATGAFVGNLLLAGRLGFARGFDVYDDALTTPEVNRPHVLERRAEDTTDRALRWLAETPSPLFLWVHYQDPHGPYTPPGPFAHRFEVPSEPDEPELKVARFGATAGRIPRYQVIEGLSRRSEYESRYVGEIAYADHSIDRLIQALDARPRPVVLLLTADHGESLGERGHYFKHAHSTTPEVARVPLILRAPGLRPQHRSEWVSHVDIAPTLLDLAGLPMMDGVRGLALAPLLRGEADWPERFVYCDHGTQLSAYTGDGFVNIHGAGGAWDPAAEASDRAPTRGMWFRWPGPHDSQPKPEGAFPLPAAIRDYLRRAVPLQRTAAPDEETLEQLRALGYAN